MVFNLLAFNKRYGYYWWLLRPISGTWGKQREIQWGDKEDPMKERCWPLLTPPDEVKKIDPRDYPNGFPRLKRNCNEDNIHQIILTECETMWPRDTHLKLYFRVYQSIANHIVLRIARKGLQNAGNEKYDEENIVEKVKSYLPCIRCASRRHRHEKNSEGTSGEEKE
jgi:hypothetical protein